MDDGFKCAAGTDCTDCENCVADIDCVGCMIIAHTSFEEPSVTEYSDQADSGMYRDTLGAEMDHALKNNPGESPVAYTACANGALELGFAAFYHYEPFTTRSLGYLEDYPGTDYHFKYCVASSLATTGARFGVVSDDHEGQAVREQYYAMANTGPGFVRIAVDPVDVIDYTSVVVSGWMYLKPGWSMYTDVIKLWATGWYNENCGKFSQIVGQLLFTFQNTFGACSMRE
jgi:hypothetical protein